MNTLRKTLLLMSSLVKDYNIKKLAIPKLGCGLDRLNWNEVELMIKEIFKDYDITIIVRYM